MRQSSLLILFFFILLLSISDAQEKSSPVYPYGGNPDETRETIGSIIPITYDNLADFSEVEFDSLAYFENARFQGRGFFSDSQFDSLADFSFGTFIDKTSFTSSRFHSIATFFRAEFYDEASFADVQFDSLANFAEAVFGSWGFFRYARFDNSVVFSNTVFNDLADFRGVQFHSRADFQGVLFNSQVDFQGARFSEDALVDLSLSTIQDTILIGNISSTDIQRYDLLRARLLYAGTRKVRPKMTTPQYYDFHSGPVPFDRGEIVKTYGFSETVSSPGATILIFGPVDLKIQQEKFEFLSLYEKLDFYSKKDIISTLKEISFVGDQYKAERFELDYIFAKSTMFQKQAGDYEEYSVFHPVVWGRLFYNATMGLGYRPFRLAWWVLGFILIFGIIYFSRMPKKINRYLSKDEAKERTSRSRQRKIGLSSGHLPVIDTIINCMCFSAMLFFAFRLKKDLLTFFNTQEKRYIVSEWLIGFLIYIFFLTFAKSGSVLHSLKSLIVG